MITYLWEQNDPGGGDFGSPLFDATKANGPLFRIFGDDPGAGANAAGVVPSRSFPDIDQVLADNTNAATGACGVDVACYSELLPTAAWVGIDASRTLHFRLTARDNHPGFGGLDSADVALTVAPGAGPFRLTSQATDTVTTRGAALPVSWDVAGTDANGVNASQVRISLSLNGGRTFTKVLAAATPNDGSEVVTVPRVGTVDGRVKVEAVGNVFYDAARGALAVDSGSPVLVNGPAAADLGAATVGGAGAIRRSPSAAMALSRRHGRALARRRGRERRQHRVRRVQRADARRLLRVCGHGPAGPGPCRRAVSDAQPGEQRPGLSRDRLADRHRDGAGRTARRRRRRGHAADHASDRFRPGGGCRRAAVQRSAFAVGAAGTLRLFTNSRSTRLGKPKASMLLAAAVCVGGSCSARRRRS